MERVGNKSQMTRLEDVEQFITANTIYGGNQPLSGKCKISFKNDGSTRTFSSNI